MKSIPMTQLIQEALDAIERAELVYVPGRDSSSIIELPKLVLANAVLAAVREQTVPRIARLPARGRAVPVVLEMTMRPKRRREG